MPLVQNGAVGESGRVRLALFAASPIYYQAPLYRILAADQRLDFTVIFSSDQGARRALENDYADAIDWGVDPLEGYKSIFLSRASENPAHGGLFALRDYDIARLIWRSDYEVLWLFGYHTITHLIAASVQKTKKRPLMYREEQNLLSPRPAWKTVIKQFGLRPLLKGSYGLFIGTENRRWFERWGIPSERLFHVPYVADEESLMASAMGSVEEARRSFGISPESGPVVAFVGRLIDKKQPLMLLEAFKRVRQRHPCTLLIVGTGEYEGVLRERIAAEDIPDVVFAGFLNQREIGRAYQAADGFALPSAYNETWGLVVNEAMAFSVPAVVSDRVGCAQDLVVPGRTGFRFPYDDVAGFAEKIERIVGDDQLRAEMGKRAREHVRAWSYSAAADGVIAATRRAVGPSRWQRAEDAQGSTPHI